jgi:predicted nucleic acid-binding protein
VPEQYKKPYLDSSVFIGWIKGEKENGVDRGNIGEHVLRLAEQGIFQVYISSLAIAEVYKRKKSPKLTPQENGKILKYFESDFILVVDVDRSIGEEANRLCCQYQSHGLMPNDAIHMACARRAGCDVLLSWDATLNAIHDFQVRTEEPQIIGQVNLGLSQGTTKFLEAHNEPEKQEGS